MVAPNSTPFAIATCTFAGLPAFYGPDADAKSLRRNGPLGWVLGVCRAVGEWCLAVRGMELFGRVAGSKLEKQIGWGFRSLFSDDSDQTKDASARIHGTRPIASAIRDI
jgi:hypothetical protein